MKRLIVVAAVLLLFVGRSAWGEVRYIVTDLGPLNSTSSVATGINASGQVVGGDTSSGSFHASLYSGGTMTDLGTLPGYYQSLANDINVSGQVVGYSYNGIPDSGNAHAFLYTDDGMIDLGTLGGTYSSANGINASGHIVGDSYTSTGKDHAFLYADGEMTDLGTFSGGSESFANGINVSGQVVGTATTSSGLSHAFLYTDGVMADLGTLPGVLQSYGVGINANGQVVGFAAASLSGRAYAFLYTDGVMTDLGSLSGSDSVAMDINASGQVVGYSFARNSYHAFLYNKNGTMLDLNNLLATPSGWTLNYANAINDNGLIVGYGVNPSGQTHAFLLTPVPEPSSLILFSVGAISLLACVWRRLKTWGGHRDRVSTIAAQNSRVSSRFDLFDSSTA